MSTEAGPDPELSSFLDAVIELAASQGVVGPRVFLQEVSRLSGHFESLAKYRTDAVLRDRLERFARRRLSLVDEAHEYQDAGNELLMLSMVLVNRPDLAAPPLQAAIVDLTEALSTEGVPGVFGKLLKRLQGLARSSADPELRHWVEGVIASLPE